MFRDLRTFSLSFLPLDNLGHLSLSLLPAQAYKFPSSLGGKAVLCGGMLGLFLPQDPSNHVKILCCTCYPLGQPRVCWEQQWVSNNRLTP